MLVMADRSFSLLGEGDEKHKKTVLTAKSKYGFLVRKTFGDDSFFFFACEKFLLELLQVCDWNKLLEALSELMNKQLNVNCCSTGGAGPACQQQFLENCLKQDYN